MHRCQAWTIPKQVQKKVQAKEMWFPLRKQQISWTAKISNETALSEADKTRSLINRIRKRQSTLVVR